MMKTFIVTIVVEHPDGTIEKLSEDVKAPSATAAAAKLHAAKGAGTTLFSYMATEK